MVVECVIEEAGWRDVDLEALAERAATATLARLGLDPAGCEIALLACDDARIAALNADFRGRPTPTNVLSWPAEHLAAAQPGGMPDRPIAGEPGEPEPLGDIALALETCRREAAEAGLALEAHLLHLIVHGVLHLCGFDHERDADATLMEDLEVEILGQMGVADPYSRTE